LSFKLSFICRQNKVKSVIISIIIVIVVVVIIVIGMRGFLLYFRREGRWKRKTKSGKDLFELEAELRGLLVGEELDDLGGLEGLAHCSLDRQPHAPKFAD
jgi:hypothetical protein